MDSFDFLNKIWHYHHLFLRPPKSFLDPYQDVSPNITQTTTNDKFLHKYVQNANGQWTALISSNNQALRPPIFKKPKKFSRLIPRCFTKYYATQNHS